MIHSLVHASFGKDTIVHFEYLVSVVHVYFLSCKVASCFVGKVTIAHFEYLIAVVYIDFYLVK